MTVVVPAHNERDRLPTCLASITVAANHVDVPVTVVVVLDACTDGSEDVVCATARLQRVSFRNVGTARAAGFASASTADPNHWLATTDADCVVPPMWLAHQAAHHRRAVQTAVGTVSVLWQEHSPATRRSYDRLYRPTGATHDHVHGANLGVRADAYWRVGGFRPLPVGEDVDLVERLVAARTRIAWDTGNPVVTSDRRDSRAPGGFGDYVKSLVDDPAPAPRHSVNS
jgi:glycosyltransferase involved in cell wall biosynthesis